MQPLLFHLLFIGVAMFQLFFIGFQWILFRRKEFLYYMGYILLCSVYVFFKVDAIWSIVHFPLTDINRQALDQPVIITAFWLYIRFGYYFLNLKKLQPNVYSAARRLEYAFLIALVIICISIPINWSHETKGKMFLAFTLALTVIALPVIIRLIRQKNMLNNFLIVGSLAIVFGGMAGPVIAGFLPAMGKDNAIVFTGIEIGILVELLLLNAGFVFKNRILQQQVIQAQQKIIKEYEQQRNDA